MSERRPNFLVFCTDQQRADHLGCAGHPVVKTPNIDRIAKRGVNFTSCHSSCPICQPARASIFTGLSHRVHGLRTNGQNLPEHVPTLPGLLADAGYRTHSVGKLHLKAWDDPDGVDIARCETPDQNPERRSHWLRGAIRKSPDNYYGFQTQDSVNGHISWVYGDYVTWLNENHPGEIERYSARDDFTTEGGLTIAPELHYNHWIADRSLDFLQGQADGGRPFFLWCSFPDPHAPFAALKGWADQYRDAEFDIPDLGENFDWGHLPRTIVEARGGREKFQEMALRRSPEAIRECYIQTFGMVSHIDEQVGRVMAGLEELGLADDTVVAYICDHGDMLGEHGLMHKNYWPYDGHAKVPFLMSVPSANGGRVVDTPVSLLDFVPTVLDLADVPQPDPDVTVEFLEKKAPIAPPLPGESLKAVLLEGKNPGRGCALVEFDEDTSAFDLIQMRVLVTEQHKLCHYSPTNELVLFDRKDDPGEMRNLAGLPEYAAVARDLLARMVMEIARTDSRLPRHTGHA